MPFVLFDPDFVDKFIDSLQQDAIPSYIGGVGPMPTEYEYRRRSSTAGLQKLTPALVRLVDVLKKLGATHLHVRYEGGHDKCTVRPDHFLFGDASRLVPDVCNAVGTRAVLSVLRQSAGVAASIPDAQLLENTVRDLALAFYIALLGKGYGCCDIQFYGEFTANLLTGQIIDNPNAPKPPHIK